MKMPKNNCSKRLSNARKLKIRQLHRGQCDPVSITPLGILPYRILMVDDEPDLRQLNVDVLTEAGYVVETAADGVQAWTALAHGSYDLLLTDNVMPHLSGAELLQKLHAARKSIPTIMVTGTLPGQWISGQPWFQRVPIMLKPYTLFELLAAVEKILRSVSGTHALT